LSGWGELEVAIDRIGSVASGESLRRVQRYVGNVTKRAALRGPESTLGPDRAMSHFRGGHKALRAGYDLISEGILLRFKPVGLWLLADRGRRSSGTIRPKRKSGHKALATPEGARARSHYGPSRGLHTYAISNEAVRVVAGPAADAAIARELARLFGVG